MLYHQKPRSRDEALLQSVIDEVAGGSRENGLIDRRAIARVHRDTIGLREQIGALSAREIAALKTHFSLGIDPPAISQAFRLPEAHFVKLADTLRAQVCSALGVGDEKTREFILRQQSSRQSVADAQLKALEAIAAKLEGEGFEALVELLEEYKELPLSGQLVEKYVDSPLFWGKLISTENEHIRSLLRATAERDGGLGIHLMSPAPRAAFMLYLRIRFSSLSEITDDEPLAHILGEFDRTGAVGEYRALKSDRRSIARELAIQNLFPVQATENDSLVVNGELSLLVDKEVVPIDAVKNLKTILSSEIRCSEDLLNYPHLDLLKKATHCPLNFGIARLAHHLNSQPTRNSPYVKVDLQID